MMGRGVKCVSLDAWCVWPDGLEYYFFAIYLAKYAMVDSVHATASMLHMFTVPAFRKVVDQGIHSSDPTTHPAWHLCAPWCHSTCSTLHDSGTYFYTEIMGPSLSPGTIQNTRTTPRTHIMHVWRASERVLPVHLHEQAFCWLLAGWLNPCLPSLQRGPDAPQDVKGLCCINSLGHR